MPERPAPSVVRPVPGFVGPLMLVSGFVLLLIGRGVDPAWPPVAAGSALVLLAIVLPFLQLAPRPDPDPAPHPASDPEPPTPPSTPRSRPG